MSSTINHERLAEVSLGDAELRDELIRLFVGDAAKQLAAMDAAAKAHDLDAWIAASHRLRGGSGNLGVERVHELCLEAESRAAEGRAEGLDELLQSVRCELETAFAALEAIQGVGE